jgi:DNA-binding NarL/FixJ family response regulator
MTAVAFAPGEPTAAPINGCIALVASDQITERRIELILLEAGFEAVAASSMKGLSELCGTQGATLAVIGCPRDALRRPWEIEAVRRRFPDLSIVVVSSGDSRHVVRDAMGAGADGYVSDAELEARLPIVVEAVLAGQICVPRSMRRQVLRIAFTQRERQVLALVRRGLSNQQIAQRMFLSESTVKSHLASAFRKLGVSSRNEAAAILSDPGELERVIGSAVRQLVPNGGEPPKAALELVAGVA